MPSAMPITLRTSWELFLVSLKLGLTSFGGPVAHLAYFHREYVVRRGWLTEASYADLVALCQALPGPASSQVGMAVGHSRGGPVGALVAWLGFTLPSALLMGAFASFWVEIPRDSLVLKGLVRGLALVALAVVSQAVWTMGRRLVTGWWSAALSVGAIGAMACFPFSWTPLAVLSASAVGGVLLFRAPPDLSPRASVPFARGGAIFCLVLFLGLLAALPWVRSHTADGLVTLADGFYRAGALVFGGGHVVLPLLQSEFVAPGLVSREAFLAGYGAVQAVPGPLFTLSAYLGFLVAGVPGALVALVAVFLPSLLLVLGVLPFWAGLRADRRFRGALAGVNAAVVGLLAWAWYDPVLLGALRSPSDLVVGVALTAGLMTGKVAPWTVVLAGAALGIGLSVAGI